MFQAFTWSCFFARKLILRELYVNYLMHEQTITFFTKAHFWLFFFKIMLESWGCGLYTSAPYIRVFTVLMKDILLDFLDHNCAQN